MKNKVILLASLLLSGWLSSVFYTDKTDFLGNNFFDFTVNNLAGIIFGLAMGVYYFINKRSHLKKIIPLIICSALAYYLSVCTALSILGSEKFNSDIPAFFIAGIIGTFILASSKNIIIGKFNIWDITAVTLIGGFAGTTFGISNSLVSNFVIWQVLVGISLVFFESEEK